jgi:hypothetical protein
MPKEYAGRVAEFISQKGIISWGIVPTTSSIIFKKDPHEIVSILLGYWDVIEEFTGLKKYEIAINSLIAPARCCLRDISDDGEIFQIVDREEKIVESAFSLLLEVSQILRERFHFF